MKSNYSIAVLPLRDISIQKDNEYFCDGISEEIISALSRIQGINVIARTSSFVFKNKKINIQEIGKKINAAYIIDGSINRYENKLRISVHLIKSENAFQVWSETWDREITDVFEIQDLIATEVVKRIHNEITFHINQNNYGLRKVDAYDLYLKAQHLLRI